MGRVLLVDHDLPARDPLELLLAEWGPHEVETASDADEALDKLQSFRPQVVVANRGLAGRDGEWLARAIRETGDTRTFIICLTGYSDEATHRRIREAGCNLILLKPVDLDTLERAVANACTRAGAPAR
jgi:DNA-binding response OmpR family regulator